MKPLYYKPKTNFKTLLNLLIFLFIINYSNGQSFEATGTDFIPPSPNAASLVNFTEASVDHKSGVMNLAIPLFSVASNDLSIQLQASYNAAGMRLKEEASTIGLGWQLTGYGVITRTVIGTPDEDLTTGYHNNNYNPAEMTWLELQNAYLQNWDLDPDVYSYRFGNYSGKFLMLKNSDGEFEFKHLVKTDLKFKKNVFGFKVVEPNGNIHEFYQKETSRRFSDETEVIPAVTAWYQTKIQTNNLLNEIILEYTTDGETSSLSNGTRTTIVKLNPNSSDHAGCPNFSDGISYSNSLSQNTYLSKIKSQFHTIDLVYENRLDINTARTNGTKRINYIELKNKSTSQLLKGFDFSYTYYTTSGDNNHKLRLDQIQEYGANKSNLPPYVFTYSADAINDKNGFKMDHWGFQNQSGSLTTPDWPIDNKKVFFNDYDFENPLREADNNCLSGLLNRIDYPTGWYESFLYELNDAGHIGNQNTHEFGQESRTLNLISNQQNQSVEGTFTIGEEFRDIEVTVFLSGNCQFEGDCALSYNIVDANGNSIYSGGGNGDNNTVISWLTPGVYTASIENFESIIEARLVIKYKKRVALNEKLAKKIGGARIKSITNPDGIKNFNYYQIVNGEEKSTGRLIDLPDYFIPVTKYTPSCASPDPGDCVNVVGCIECPRMRISSSSVMQSFSSEILMYEKVKEILTDNSYIEYEFDYIGDIYSPSYIPRISREHVRGNLKEKKYYNNTSQIVKSEEYIYNYELLERFNVDVLLWTQQTDCEDPRLDLYYHPIYWTKLEEVKITDYTTGNLDKSVSVINKYTYSPNGLYTNPVTSSTTNSNNKIHETRYKYYDEYTDDDATTNDTNIKTWLQTNNIIEPWETTTYVYDNATDTSPKQIDGTRFEYNNFGTSVYYPKKFDRYEVTSDENGALDNIAGWQNQHLINTYNTSVGKPTSITVDGWSNPTTYTWTSTGNLNTKTYKDFITDYNYHPDTDLLSEIIEPDGQKTTFTYDDFMRLDIIESRGGKVKKEYNYSYQPNYIEEIATFNDTGTANDITHTTKTTFDGLGRDIQIDQVGHKWNSPDINITVLKEYNNRGLLEKVYEPDDDAIITAADKFTEYTYYPDPLGRVQTVTDPMGFVTETSFGTNTAEIEGFDANSLYKETVTDADGISTSSYTDKLGRAVATLTFKGTDATITYTNYDDKSRVTSIIPPGATPNDAGLIYQYTYDGADNVLTTKFPDKGLMQYQYDARNLQTAMQDANMKAKGKWLNSNYDAYGRLHQQGFGTSPNTVTDLLLHNYYDNNDAVNTVNTTTPIYKGKLHKSKVNILNGFNKGADYLTTSYSLDAYGRVNKETTNTNHIGKLETVDYTYDMADNILTNKHKVGGTTATESFYFDSKGRLTLNEFDLINTAVPDELRSTSTKKTIANYASYSLKDELLSKNIGAKTGGYLQTADYAYNANGWLKTINGGSVAGSKDNCTAINSISNADLFALDIKYADAALPNHIDRKNGNISEIYWQVKDRAKNAYRFNYDYLNRLTEAKHYVNASYKGEYDANYAYDERGNIMELSRNGLVDEGANCTARKKQIDNLTYLYEEGTNKLAMVFDCAGVNSGQHVNPISNTNYTNKYITSDAKTNTPGGTNNTGNINFVAGTYITLKPGFEYTTKTNGEFHATISDAACPSNSNLSNYGFKGEESSYRYDANGNLTYDSQKQLGIAYNHLNLPYKAQKDANNKIEWLYTADGRKLQKKVTENGTAKTKNYLGNMEFTQNTNGINTLEAAYHSEGRVLKDNTWEYNLKDHLGNVRLVFKENNGNAKIVQENHYYPFGMQQNGNWAKTQNIKNDYLYNGKELNSEIGLNWSDYGFRYYDSAVGRFTGVDPKAALLPSYSPYAYAVNNPIIMIDPDGQYPIYFITRSYAPFKTFGPNNNWYGDDRGHTLDRGTSYRGLASIMHDTETLKTTAFGGHSRSHTVDGQKNAMSRTRVFNRSEGNNIDVRSSAPNEAQSGAQPIDQFTKLSVSTEGDIKSDHILNITGDISGDNFPNQESFIYDSDGNSLWLGNFETSGDRQTGPVFNLFFENEGDKQINVNIQINVNSDGVFQSVIQGDKTIFIDDWNKQFE